VPGHITPEKSAAHDLKAAPAYEYYFTWQTPVLDGLRCEAYGRASIHPRRRRWRR
jgi:hypothetical protein